MIVQVLRLARDVGCGRAMEVQIQVGFGVDSDEPVQQAFGTRKDQGMKSLQILSSQSGSGPERVKALVYVSVFEADETADAVAAVDAGIAAVVVVAAAAVAAGVVEQVV